MKIRESCGIALVAICILGTIGLISYWTTPRLVKSQARIQGQLLFKAPNGTCYYPSGGSAIVFSTTGEWPELWMREFINEYDAKGTFRTNVPSVNVTIIIGVNMRGEPYISAKAHAAEIKLFVAYSCKIAKTFENLKITEQIGPKQWATRYSDEARSWLNKTSANLYAYPMAMIDRYPPGPSWIQQQNNTLILYGWKYQEVVFHVIEGTEVDPTTSTVHASSVIVQLEQGESLTPI